MKCALCKEKEADKKNTHYLTDSIIRSCLNEDGGNEREKGMYYDISSDKIFTEFNFQRVTTMATLEKELGRAPTDEEIEKAKTIPFSVDYVFCTKCESIFTEIENAFAAKFLPLYRESDLSKTESISSGECKLLRLFFSIQVWRTSVCSTIFKLSPQVEEKLRLLILNPVESELKAFPLTVTYLTTRGDAKEYTTNFVGYASGVNPHIIFMNDFIIQFYESGRSIPFSPLYGINEFLNFGLYLNYMEEEFIIKIITNERRKEIMLATVTDIKVKPLLNNFATSFVEHWTNKYGEPPSDEMTKTYIEGLVDWKDLPRVQQLSRERVKEYVNGFFKKYGKK